MHRPFGISSCASVRALAIAAGLIAAALGSNANAGTIRADRSDSLYRNLATGYPAVGDVLFTESGAGYRGSGTLVAPNWVLTAGHIVDGGSSVSSMTFSLGGITYTANQWIANPNWTGNLATGYDIGLFHLTTPVTSIAPATRYTGTAEKGKVGTFVGFGTTGTGLTGYQNGTSGTKRAGNNTIDVFGSAVGYSDQILLADFDDPNNKDHKNAFGSTSPLDLEYSIAPGDSGGGVFVNFGSGPTLVGVNSFIGALSGRNGDGVTNASYSDVFGATRVTYFNSWIDSIIGGSLASTSADTQLSSGGGGLLSTDDPIVPEPSTFILAALGILGLGLIAWQKKRRWA
ncbi:MAG: trypsin-like serine protease [Planctomycetia bacterium]|nr:trypsin-like serine protease [Planctomycetia bacterium]